MANFRTLACMIAVLLATVPTVGTAQDTADRFSFAFDGTFVYAVRDYVTGDFLLGDEQKAELYFDPLSADAALCNILVMDVMFGDFGPIERNLEVVPIPLALALANFGDSYVLHASSDDFVRAEEITGNDSVEDPVFYIQGDRGMVTRIENGQNFVPFLSGHGDAVAFREQVVPLLGDSVRIGVASFSVLVRRYEQDENLYVKIYSHPNARALRDGDLSLVHGCSE